MAPRLVILFGSWPLGSRCSLGTTILIGSSQVLILNGFIFNDFVSADFIWVATETSDLLILRDLGEVPC